MRLGVGTYSFRWALGMGEFPRTMDLADVLERAHDLGAGLIQIADSTELDTASDDHLRHLAERAEAHGIDLQIGTTGADSALLLKYLHIARMLQADLVRLVLHHDEKDVNEDAAVSALTRVADAYSEADVTIGIENHFLTTSTAMIRILERVDSPHVRVVLDVANSIACGEWPQETIDTLAPYAVGLHLKDYEIVPDREGVGAHLVGAPLGQGWLDLEATISTLERTKALTENFAVILEHWSPRGNSAEVTYDTESEWLKQSFSTARTLLSRFDAKESTHAE